jgi:hypothetical protein
VLTTPDDLIVATVPPGWAGGDVPYRRLSFPSPASIRKSLLRDIDGDGYIDLVTGLRTPLGSNQIIYGPLWDGLAEANAKGLDIDQLPTTHSKK